MCRRSRLRQGGLPPSSAETWGSCPTGRNHQPRFLPFTFSATLVALHDLRRYRSPASLPRLAKRTREVARVSHYFFTRAEA
eukprot:286883-Heterocapsa_arctica.AAC.1